MVLVFCTYILIWPVQASIMKNANSSFKGICRTRYWTDGRQTDKTVKIATKLTKSQQYYQNHKQYKQNRNKTNTTIQGENVLKFFSL